MDGFSFFYFFLITIVIEGGDLKIIIDPFFDTVFFKVIGLSHSTFMYSFIHLLI